MAGFEPAPQGLEGPQATVTPHSHLVRPTGIAGSTRRGAAQSSHGGPREAWSPTRPSALATRGAFLHTQAERGPVSSTGPSRSVSFQRPRSCELGGRQGIRTQSLPWGRTGLRPVSGPSARTARLATVPGFEPGRASFGGSALEARMLPLRHAAVAASRLDHLSETEPPRDLARIFFRALGQTKKAF